VSSTCTSVLYCWLSAILFSFPFSPKLHSIVPLLQTCSSYEFVYDHVCFCAYAYLWDISSQSLAGKKRANQWRRRIYSINLVNRVRGWASGRRCGPACCLHGWPVCFNFFFHSMRTVVQVLLLENYVRTCRN
jgi:hypothetical protein